MCVKKDKPLCFLSGSNNIFINPLGGNYYYLIPLSNNNRI